MRPFLTALCALGVVACGGGEKSSSTVADSLSRDLQLAQQDSTNALSDTAATPAAPATQTPAPAPAAAKPAPTPKPKPPAPKPAASLAAGTTFSATANDTVSSRKVKSGGTMTATVGADVKAADGRVVIPAGSVVTITLDQFKSAPTKGGKETFAATVTSVAINGTSYPVSGKVDHVDYTLKGRGITGGTAAKVGAGAAAGALIGQAIGKNSTGTIVGGVAGAAAGAAVANETGDQDITILPGAAVSMTLTGAFTAK